MLHVSPIKPPISQTCGSIPVVKRIFVCLVCTVRLLCLRLTATCTNPLSKIKLSYGHVQIYNQLTNPVLPSTGMCRSLLGKKSTHTRTVHRHPHGAQSGYHQLHVDTDEKPNSLLCALVVFEAKGASSALD